MYRKQDRALTASRKEKAEHYRSVRYLRSSLNGGNPTPLHSAGFAALKGVKNG